MAKRETCSACLRPLKACYCNSINKLDTESRILILRHFKEKDHPFNTARMAELSLANCRVLDSDDTSFPQDLSEFISLYNPFLVFFNKDSLELNENIEQLPSNNFILLDGTWDKAKKILYSTPQLQELKIYHLTPSKETIYRPIRKACADGFLSTIEALKVTLDQIYPDQEFGPLLSPLEYTVNLQLELRKKPL